MPSGSTPRGTWLRSRLPRGRRAVVAGVGAVAVVALLVVAAVVVVDRVTGPSGPLARAAAVSPASSQRLSFTDWAGVRAELDPDLDASSSGQEVRAFLDRGFGRGLTSTSAMVASAAPLQEDLGLSPATVAWEGFSQSTEGAVVAMRLDDDRAVDELGDRLAGLGFTAPPEDDGVWTGGADLLAGIDPTISPVFGYAVLLADEGLVLTSDDPTYLETAREAALGDAGSMLDEVGSVVAPSPDALSAAVYTGEYACGELAMTTADATAQAEAETLEAEAVAGGGRLSPITAFAMARLPGGEVRTALGFETADLARENADPRARLASGPAPGQGGTFDERFTLDGVVADGDAVVLDMTPRRRQLLLSDLSTGPVLFATC